MSTVDVRSIDALDALSTGLIRYAAQAQATLDAVQREVQRTLEWLDERVRHWQNEVRRSQEAVQQAVAAYHLCLASGDRDDPPACGHLEAAVHEARRRLAQTDAELRMAVEARKAVLAEVEAYQREAGRLRALLRSDTPKAVATLRSKVSLLHDYVASGMTTTGVHVENTQSEDVEDWTGIAWLWGVAMAAAPQVRLADRFHGSQQELQAFYETALEQLAKTAAGAALSRALPLGVSIRSIVERDMGGDYIDELSFVAGTAAKGNPRLSMAQIGTLVHRVAELRAIYRHPDEILNGTRYAEQPILVVGQKARVELDDIIKRGDSYFLRDYKPINLAKYAATPQGALWKHHLEQQLGGDFDEQMSLGRNPFCTDMPRDIRADLRSWLENEKDQHEAQLSLYRDAFLAAHSDVQCEQVRTSVRPYFVYRYPQEE